MAQPSVSPVLNNSIPMLLNRYLGVWNPIGNTPQLRDGVGTEGDYYIVLPQVLALSVPPADVKPFINRDLGSGNKSWVANFHIYYDGSIWKQMEFGDGGAGSVPNLQQVATVGNESLLPLYPAGFGANTTQTGSNTYTPIETDFTILCDCTFADTNIILPTIDSTNPVKKGRMFCIKKTKGNFIVVVTVDGGLDIDGVSTHKIGGVNNSIIVQLNQISGQEYHILAAYS